MDSLYDEGFASSSSLEDAQTKDIIRRRRAQSLHRKKPSHHVIPTDNTAATTTTTATTTNITADTTTTAAATVAGIETKGVNVNSLPSPMDTLRMAVVERILWILSFLWSISHMVDLPGLSLNTHLLLGWTLLILTGLSICHAFSRSYNNKKATLTAAKHDVTLDRSYTETSSEDSPNPTSCTKSSKMTTTTTISNNTIDPITLNSISPTNRIFGSSRAAFRSNADDGLLCGVLLLPMVACAQLTSVIRQDETDQLRIALYQAKLELILLMSLIFLILVSVDGFLHPVKKRIRKRGLFVSSLLIAGIFTFFMTRLTPLTPILGDTPILLTIVSVTTFQWFLYLCVVALKRCFTLGEMCVISQAGAVMAHKAQEMIYTTFYSNKVPDYIRTHESTPETILIYAVLLGMMLIGCVSYPVLRQSRLLAQKPYWRSSALMDTLTDIQRRKIITAISFYCLTAAIIAIVISPICTSMLHQNPFLWTLEFLFSSPPRLFLCIYWVIAIGITVIIWVLLLDFPATLMEAQLPDLNQLKSKRLTSTLNKKRKLFHGLAVVMFIPGLLFANSFLQLAFGVALSAFIYLEYLRYFAVWPYGKNLHMFLSEFIDNRDLGPVILSHIYLLIGCAVPVWLANTNVFAGLSGILSLGFGDALASLIGKRFGKYHWPGTKKTVEGTLAFIITVFLSALILAFSSILFRTEDSFTLTLMASAGRREWLRYFMVVTMTGLLEAFSFQNDNIIIPLYMYALVVQCQLY